MSKLNPTYPYYDTYQWLTGKARQLVPEKLEEVSGVTAHYGLPDLRFSWQGIRILGIFPRPKGVSVLLECRKFLAHRDRYPAEEIDAFEDARGALPLLGNGLLVVQAPEDVDEGYLDRYLENGMDLLLREIKRRHPGRARSCSTPSTSTP